MNGLLPLAAGQENVIFWAIVILIVIISFVVRMVGKLRELGPGPRPPQQRPLPPPGGPRPGAPPARDAVRAEIDEFLQRAGRRPPVGRPQAPGQPGPPRPGVAPPRPVRPAPAQGPVEAELELTLEEEDVPAHVRQHVPAQEFGHLASDVGARLSKVGETADTRLHEVFDHQLGRIGAVPGESARPAQLEEAETPEDRITSLPATAAAGLAAILASPVGLRQAILLNEIFQRPEHRWE